MKFLVLIYIAFTVFSSNAYKIMVFFPMPVRSMNFLGEGIVKHLVKAGHEVTFVTSFPLKNNPENFYRQIDVSENQAVLTNQNDGTDAYNFITATMDGQTDALNTKALQEMALGIATLTFELKNLKNFLQDTSEHFDAVIADLFETEIYSGLAAIYDCPLIWAYSMGVHWHFLKLIDGPTNPAYTSDYMSPNFPPLNFLQRIEELWAQIERTAVKWYNTLPKEEAAYEKYFRPLLTQRGRTLPNYQELIYNASLILSNEYYSFGNIPSTPQNFKFIAGQHIDTPTKPLPKELKSLMDNAEHGVIYFSLGSACQSKDIPHWITERLLKVFGELKQTVIWKYEEDLLNLPENVHILKWAPQHSILAHPNCLFFISHGGLLSSTEAVHFGVPIIGVPVFMDQFINVNKAVARGYAIKVDLNYELAENLKSAIAEMLSDEKYKRKVKELFLVYHDRLVPPGAELVHWVEHVVRTRGAPHLRSPALHVPCYQKMYLDLMAVIVAVLMILKFVINRVFCSSKKTNVMKKNN